MNNKLIICILLVISTLNSIGIGIIIPVLPQLLRNIMGNNNIYLHYGMLLMIYALFQLFFAPILGTLSDKFGKRKILLISLFGSAVEYGIMAFFLFCGYFMLVELLQELQELQRLLFLRIWQICHKKIIELKCLGFLELLLVQV